MKEVINPTDIAVALTYDGKKAPRVTAKGRGETAEKIIALAKEHNVPLHTDVALVKVLSKISLGDEIPRELYLAIAQVIAFAYLISGKRPGGK
jgi:flagellar biosynthesis protein